MKRISSILLAAVTAAMLLTGCTSFSGGKTYTYKSSDIFETLTDFDIALTPKTLTKNSEKRKEGENTVEDKTYTFNFEVENNYDSSKTVTTDYFSAFNTDGDAIDDVVFDVEKEITIDAGKKAEWSVTLSGEGMDDVYGYMFALITDEKTYLVDFEEFDTLRYKVADITDRQNLLDDIPADHARGSQTDQAQPENKPDADPIQSEQPQADQPQADQPQADQPTAGKEPSDSQPTSTSSLADADLHPSDEPYPLVNWEGTEVGNVMCPDGYVVEKEYSTDDNTQYVFRNKLTGDSIWITPYASEADIDFIEGNGTFDKDKYGLEHLQDAKQELLTKYDTPQGTVYVIKYEKTNSDLTYSEYSIVLYVEKGVMASFDLMDYMVQSDEDVIALAKAVFGE